MAMFKDQNGQEWRVELNAPTITEIQARHGIELTNLERDPLIKLRNDPMILVAVTQLICERQMETRNLSPTEFAEALPYPPDDMLIAVKDAVIGFFPSGRASHVREVLTKYEEIATKSDEIVLEKMASMQPAIFAKMRQKANDPAIAAAFDQVADVEWDAVMRKMYPLDSVHTT